MNKPNPYLQVIAGAINLANPRLRFLANLPSNSGPPAHDLDHPDFNPPDCPEWAKESLQESISRFRGRNGQPHPHRDRSSPLAMTVLGIDRYHANQFIVFRPETADFLYSEYTPTNVPFRRGLLPKFEKLAALVTQDCASDTEKAVALLQRGASRVKHPQGPPCGDWVSANRNLDDEALLASGSGWCNEQARIFVRLCQVSGIPARIIQLFYSDEKSGHCIAEFYADGRWCMADATWFCVFPGEDGHLLSAAQCHDGGKNQEWCGHAYEKRWAELLTLSDESVNFNTPEETRVWRESLRKEDARSLADKHYYFGIINYPLPN